jgi:hypothetical protein
MNFIKVSVLSSLIAFQALAGEIPPIAEGSQAAGPAEVASAVSKVKNFSAGGVNYRVSWMDSILNGDLNETVIVLASTEPLCAACDAPAAFQISPGISPDDDVMNVIQVRVESGKVYLQLLHSDFETKSWIRIKYNPAKGTLSSVNAKPKKP